MTPEVRDEAIYESSLEILSTWRILSHMRHVPLSGFPYAHILSLMNQLPVRKGMKTAYEKWKVEKKMVREKQLIV
jgi:hypothetical protein